MLTPAYFGFLAHDDRADHYLIAKIAAQFLGGSQVHLTAQQFRKFNFHTGDSQQAGHVPGMKGYQDVDVAVRPEALRQYRTEERKSPDVIPQPEVINRLLRQGDRQDVHGTHFCLPISHARLALQAPSRKDFPTR